MLRIRNSKSLARYLPQKSKVNPLINLDNFEFIVTSKYYTVIKIGIYTDSGMGIDT